MMNTGKGNNYCRAEFNRFDGTYVFKLKKTNGGEGDIKYTSSLGDGELNVYYDIHGTKELLFSITGGESVNDRGGYIESEKTVYIIIEAVSTSDGSVYIELE